MFNIHAYLDEDVNKTIFDGTMPFLPRLEEFITIGISTFKVKSIRYIFQDGTSKITQVRMALEQII